MWKFYLSLLGVVSVEFLLGFPVCYSSFSKNESYGEALFLTPILEKGNVSEARKLSQVRTPEIGNVLSYSGYLTVNKQCQSNLFFWFFPAKNQWEQAPVTLWLQGGPGGSSLFGLFEEIGPFSFEKILKPRKISWDIDSNLLFIDQPVGTGFSFTGKNCYATNETQVSEELYSALIQFFQLFPELKRNKFILAGESYAGYYIPAIGYKIHQSNQYADFKINLEGMMIGNGWMDEMYQGNKSEYMFQIGLSYSNQKDQFKEKNHVSGHHMFGSSYNLHNVARIHSMSSRHQNFNNYDPYNYVKTGSSLDPPYNKYLQLKHVRKSIHVGNQEYNVLSGIVYDYLFGEKTKIKPLVEELLEFYPIVFYNGQLDTVCPYPLLVNFLRALHWSGAEDYERAQRHMWCKDGVLAGYYRSARNLHEVMVRNAGHMVPMDQPLWAFRLAHSVISNPPDNPLGSVTSC